jgi:hypothetical protein
VAQLPGRGAGYCLDKYQSNAIRGDVTKKAHCRRAGQRTNRTPTSRVSRLNGAPDDRRHQLQFNPAARAEFRSLIANPDNAQAAEKRGNLDAMLVLISAFINEVSSRP